MTFQLVQWVDQSELVRVEQHSDENEARQRGCGLSAVGRAVLCGQWLSTVKGRPGRGGRGGGWVGGWMVGWLVGWCSFERTRIPTVRRQHPQCAANVAFFRLKLDQLIERR